MAAALLLAACGEDEASTSATATQSTTAASGGYSPVSDVDPHAAIGKDIAEIRAILEPAKEGKDADFAAAAAIWSDGANSVKDDGSKRTLASFVEGTDVETHVDAALGGTGDAADLDAAQRRQWVDKGTTVALRAKVLAELDAAREKAAAGETDPADGAPHNVDEAWAFYVAEGEGIQSTAEKRAADYGLPENELSDEVVAALTAALTAAQAGDAQALERAQEQTRGALNTIFAMAVNKYAVEGQNDPVAQEEGRAFAWALLDDLPAAQAEELSAAFDGKMSAADAEQVATLLDEQRDALAITRELPAFKG
jgi:hypothetical protein